MKSIKSIRAIAVFLGIVTGMADVAQSGPIAPAFDSFGSLPAATFGGTGIPNDAVAITTITSGNEIITLGLSASERFANPPVGDDGAGTFNAKTGANFGDPAFGLPPSSFSGATWNFNFFISIVGGSLDNFLITLLYDLDPGAGTDDSLHGIIDFNAGGTGLPTTVQGSQNPLFGFLSTGAPGVTPPGGSFDPNAAGEYTFALRVKDLNGQSLGEAAIRVNVVPEPGTLAIFGLGLAGLGLMRRRRRVA